MVNLILGLGGTGAKIVESFVHLCATGLGPDRAAVAFVDQDQSNGNTLRARTALARYAAAREALWKAKGEKHQEPGGNLLRTRLYPHSSHPDPSESDFDGCHWVPQKKSDVHLASLMRYSLMREESHHRGVARAFFHLEQELRMRLNEGYRGRPHVGSTAFLMCLEDDEFWRSLSTAVSTANEEVRVFLCGSAFGGTGAAVLPSLARRLRHVAVETSRQLRTAGVLMLPYFTFALPENRDANVAVGHELLLQSQAALRYYHNEAKSGGRDFSFDELYFVGWDPVIELNYHSPGAAAQANPPLAPELFGALAAARFFRRELMGECGGKQDLHLVARAARHRLEWSDLPDVPSVRNGGAREVHTNAARAYPAWLRFCAAWHFYFAKALGDRSEFWYRTYFGESHDNEVVSPVSDYVSMALRYAAAMSAFSRRHGEPGEESFNLWTHGKIAAVDRNDPAAEPDLEGGALSSSMKDFEDLVRSAGDVSGFADVHWVVSNEKPSSRTPGLWPFVTALYRCVDSNPDGRTA